jgi:hypothetical protein
MDDIDNSTLRRMVLSTAVLQEQLIACCCGQTPEPEPADLELTLNADGQEGSYVVALVVNNHSDTVARNIKVESTFVVDGDVESIGDFDPDTDGQWTDKAPPSPYIAALAELGPDKAWAPRFTVKVVTGRTVVLHAKVISDNDPNSANDTASVQLQGVPG